MKTARFEKNVSRKAKVPRLRLIKPNDGAEEEWGGFWWFSEGEKAEKYSKLSLRYVLVCFD